MHRAMILITKLLTVQMYIKLQKTLTFRCGLKSADFSSSDIMSRLRRHLFFLER